ncbi:hypothetical protein J1N35_035224 [Gossypium stocksii]|uniref:F-box domain-containing protein n=1 Tax=Gossypium stocksii TaxID=47602 RepID=A0A9D3ZQR9_9ROSI|nr:hypothetical protein J1N35_035224 [Gossypium stocksii]
MASSLPLSQNTIFDILSRLPLKSVTRFKSLSKDWTYLTSTPTFLTDHLRCSSSNPSLILLCYNTQFDFDFGILLITDPTQNFTCQHLAIPLEEPLPLFPKIIGSIDYLVNDGDAKDGCDESGYGEIVGMEKNKYKYIGPFM